MLSPPGCKAQSESSNLLGTFLALLIHVPIGCGGHRERVASHGGGPVRQTLVLRMRGAYPAGAVCVHAIAHLAAMGAAIREPKAGLAIGRAQCLAAILRTDRAERLAPHRSSNLSDTSATRRGDRVVAAGRFVGLVLLDEAVVASGQAAIPGGDVAVGGVPRARDDDRAVGGSRWEAQEEEGEGLRRHVTAPEQRSAGAQRPHEARTRRFVPVPCPLAARSPHPGARSLEPLPCDRGRR